MAGDRNFVLMKRGLYWGPDFSGYVGALANAGRYTEAEARSRIDAGEERPTVTMHRVEDCPEFSPKCWPETQIEILRRERDDARLQLTALRAEASRLRAFQDAAYQVAGPCPAGWHTNEPAWSADLFEVERRVGPPVPVDHPAQTLKSGEGRS